MRESEKAAAYTEAINLLVDQAVTAAKPKSPGAYAATVRADLSERHREAARDAFRKYGDLTGEHLALLLAAADKPQPAPPVNTPPAIGPWTPPEHEPTAGRVLTRTEVRQRIADLKAQLRTVTKPPMGERADTTRGAVAR